MKAFFVVLIIIFTKTLNTVKADVCREGIFKPSKATASRFTVTKNISVDSVFDCAHSCRAEVACEAFRHRNFPPNDAINCQLSQGKPELLGKVDESEEWTVYTLQTVGLGFPVKSLDRDDFDIVFPGPEANDYIDLPNIISKELSGFTYSAWFKFNPGIDSYQLFSYTIENSTKIIDLRFKTAFGSLVAKFNQVLFGEFLRAPMIPVNDGFWHHVGFSWSGILGKCTLLIDGVLLATYEDIFQGKKMPPGGNATIGITTLDTATHYLVGRISRVNLWSVAKTGHEIEQLAKSPGSDAGDVLRWRVVQDYVSEKLSVVRPSTAAFTGNGMNYDLSLPLSEEIRYSGPSEDINVLSIAFWFKGSSNTLFLEYDTNETFLFGYKSSSLISIINNFDTSRTVTGNSNYWHFLCLAWDGKKSRLNYYYDGQLLVGKIDSVELNTHLPAGKDFVLGLDSEIGTLTQLNIWNYRLFSDSVLAMSAGGCNVHGNLLSWVNLQEYLNVENITRGSEIYLPGFAVLASRTEWCNGVHPSTACSGQLLARLGGDLKKESMLWRCYCPSSLLPSKATYDFKALSSYYRTSHTNLTRIN